MRTYDEEEIRELILCLDNIYNSRATSIANELERLVGTMSPYSDGDELMDDDIILIETAENIINS